MRSPEDYTGETDKTTIDAKPSLFSSARAIRIVIVIETIDYAINHLLE